MTDTLTIADVIALETIVTMAAKTQKYARAHDDGEVSYGTARMITNGDMMSLGNKDIRDGYLWVTSRSGWEYEYPIRELIADVKNHEFTAYNW